MNVKVSTLYLLVPLCALQVKCANSGSSVWIVRSQSSSSSHVIHYTCTASEFPDGGHVYFFVLHPLPLLFSGTYTSVPQAQHPLSHNLTQPQPHVSRARARDGLLCSGRKKEVIDEEKDRMWEVQQEMLKARRAGTALDGVSERRRVAKEAVCCMGPSVRSSASSAHDLVEIEIETGRCFCTPRRIRMSRSCCQIRSIVNTRGPRGAKIMCSPPCAGCPLLIVCRSALLIPLTVKPASTLQRNRSPEKCTLRTHRTLDAGDVLHSKGA
jgi:hypothetical protein